MDLANFDTWGSPYGGPLVADNSPRGYNPFMRLLAWLGFLVAVQLASPSSVLAAAGVRSSIPLDVATVAQTFVVRGHQVRAEAAAPELVDPYMGLLMGELKHYSHASMSAFHLRTVVVCGELTSGGTSFNAMADWDRHVLYLAAMDPRENSHYAQVVVHHELFHLLDQAMTGNLAYDPVWTALNSRGFVYGSGGDSMREADASELGSASEAGFVTRYATSGVDEDKAETFAHLMVDRTWVLQQAAHDDVLQHKIAAVRQRLNRYVPGWGDSL
jgi:hypothetical protein